MSMCIPKMMLAIGFFFVWILVGFAVAFHILLPRHESFNNPVTSTIKVIISITTQRRPKSSSVYLTPQMMWSPCSVVKRPASKSFDRNAHQLAVFCK